MSPQIHCGHLSDLIGPLETGGRIDCDSRATGRQFANDSEIPFSFLAQGDQIEDGLDLSAAVDYSNLASTYHTGSQIPMSMVRRGFATLQGNPNAKWHEQIRQFNSIRLIGLDDAYVLIFPKRRTLQPAAIFRMSSPLPEERLTLEMICSIITFQVLNIINH